MQHCAPYQEVLQRLRISDQLYQNWVVLIRRIDRLCFSVEAAQPPISRSE